MNGDSILLAAVLAVQIMLAGCVFWALPTWSRPELFFSITVPRGFRLSPEGRSILARYRALIGVVAAAGAIALVLTLRLPDEALRLTAALGGVTVLQLAGSVAAFVHARGRVLPHAVEPSPLREATLSTSVPRSLSRAQWTAFLVPLLLVAGTAVVVLFLYPSFPETIPTHFNAQGEADAFREKSVGVLLLPLGIGAALLIFITFLAQWLVRALPVRTAGEAALQLDRRRRTAVVELLGAVLYLTAAIMILVTAGMVVPPAAAQPVIVAALVVSLLAGGGLPVWFLFRHGSAFTASHRSAESGADDATIGDRTADRHWKLGLIYFNPDDPAVWVEKRIGIGYTTNMARSEPWFMLGGLVLLLTLIVLAAVLVG